MSKLAAKQINKYLMAMIALSNIAVSNANSSNVSTALNGAVGTAGDGGAAVPLSAISSLPATAMGVVVATGDNEVDVIDHTTQLPIVISGATVYGRITYAAGGPTFTVAYYTLVNGVETVQSINQSVDLFVPYIFDFANFPQDGAVRTSEMRPGGAGGGRNGLTQIETVTATGTNTISSLSKAPINTANVVLNVNGVDLYSGDHFSVSAAGAITISTAQTASIGFNITSTDYIKARYAA